MNEIKIYKLNCASCNSNLEVPSDIDKFNCSYCGTQQIVERSGGIIALKEVVDAIGKVQTGTDKTAAELALHRLSVELINLQNQRNEKETYWQSYISEQLKPIEVKIKNTKTSALGCGCGTLIILFIALYIIGHNFDLKDSMLGAVLVFLFLLLPVIAGILGYKSGKSEKAKFIKERDEILAQLTHHKTSDLDTIDMRITNVINELEKNRKLVGSY